MDRRLNLAVTARSLPASLARRAGMAVALLAATAAPAFATGPANAPGPEIGQAGSGAA